MVERWVVNPVVLGSSPRVDVVVMTELVKVADCDSADVSSILTDHLFCQRVWWLHGGL